jgi:hypothetical protein
LATQFDEERPAVVVLQSSDVGELARRVDPAGLPATTYLLSAARWHDKHGPLGMV